MLASRITAHTSASASCRRAVVATRVASPPACFLKPVASRHSRRHQHVVYAAEEATTTAEASTSDASAGSQSESEVESTKTALQRAREALESKVDKATVEAALADLDAEIVRLQDVAAAAESKAAVLESTVSTAKDQLLRLNADFDNFRRRSKEEKEALAESVRGDVVQQLLPLVDNFELARTQVKVETDAEAKINNSYQGLYKQMVDIMRGLGIEAVPTTGTPFDPEIHEAIMREPDETVADGTVLQEFRKGFRIGSKLIRPAMVKVSVNEGGAPTEQ